MMKYIDINNWNRKPQFELFKMYDNPFFNITADVDVTDLHQFAKTENKSFFLLSLYVATRAANEIEPFRMRIQDEQVVMYDVIHTSSTVARDDSTFGFCYFPYSKSLDIYLEAGLQAIEDVKKHNTLDPKVDQHDVLHFSVIPWISFTSIQHARKFSNMDSIPKITMGKFYRQHGRLKMPLSIEVHHALMDGYHVGQYFSLFEQHCSDFSLA